MWKHIAFFGLILLAGTATASAQNASEPLRASEYGAVALIFTEEISALGGRALYPVCVGTLSDTPLKPLLGYLRKGGQPISDPSVCEPGLAPGGQHHPKDYPHGLRIFVDKPQRDPGGQVAIHVEATDLTVRPGEHFALTLRRGTYHFKQNEAHEWQITGYTKEYDSKDEKQVNCDAAAK